MTLICECGSHDLEFEYQHYPEDENGRAVGVATEEYKCARCGRTGTYRFGKRNGIQVDEKSGCLTTTFEQ